MARYELDYHDLLGIVELVGNADRTLADVISDVNQTFSHVEIKKNIMDILPVSGRKPWGGKKPKIASASSSQPFTEIFPSKLSLTVKTITPYNYLYFPDDGSNTDHHAGNQHFMERGGLEASDAIINRIRDEFISNFK